VKVIIYGLIALVVVARLIQRSRKRAKEGKTQAAETPTAPPASKWIFGGGPPWVRNDVLLVAMREIQARTRSKIFRIGTLVILVGVSAGVVLPVLLASSSSSSSSNMNVGVVGTVSGPLREAIKLAGESDGTGVNVHSEPSLTRADRALRAGTLDVVLNPSGTIEVAQPVSENEDSNQTALAQSLAQVLGIQNGLQRAGLSASKAVESIATPPLAIHSLALVSHTKGTPHSTDHAAALYGIILIYVLLTQYGTWILIGVVEEKSSRVVEVLLSSVGPTRLLVGKVLGIGAVALTQGLLIIGVVLIDSAAVGSNLLKGSGPLEMLTILFWLLMGYFFNCWVYAAVGSLAERQENIQTMAFPLQLPVLLGYIVSLVSLSATHVSLFEKVLAYLPPTAPFAMSVLVAVGDATWWEFVLSALISLVFTFGVIKVASTVYGRALLRTGRRVKLREVLASG
jgi:ABC-2 type transport system permease protein